MRKNRVIGSSGDPSHRVIGRSGDRAKLAATYPWRPEISIEDRAARDALDNAWWYLVTTYGRDDAVIFLEAKRREVGAA